jgi:hypothetical protein
MVSFGEKLLATVVSPSIAMRRSPISGVDQSVDEERHDQSD